jgi:hypothetical protein
MNKKQISPLVLIALLLAFIVITVLFALIAAKGPGVLYVPTTMFGMVAVGVLIKLTRIYHRHKLESAERDEHMPSLQELGTVGKVRKFPGVAGDEAKIDESTLPPSEREDRQEMKGQLGWSFLHKASTTGDEDTADLTLEEGISLESRDILGFTPLHQACRLLNAKMVAYLIAKGAPLEARNDVGWTPLHVSVNLDAWDIVKILLDNGADARATTPKGETPVHLAQKQGYKELAEMLQRYLIANRMER